MADQLPFKFPERYSYTGERLEGGQGYVYICQDALLERRVAIKVVSTPVHMQSLKQELSFLTEIRSPHIAEIYDLFEAKSGKHIGLAEQYVSGAHLQNIVGKCDLPSFLRTMYQLCAGVSDIHCANKVHRDIKPGNIRFDEEGVLKILDFGISQHVDGIGNTVHGKGTLPYLAPELFSLPAKYTSAVDVYSCGVIASELAFGTLDASLKQKPPQSQSSPAKFAQSPLPIPADICDLFDRTLAPKPDNRPSINEVEQALERRLNYGLHRAAVTYDGQTNLINQANRSLLLKSGNCSVTIVYDGMRFTANAVSGNVDINNIQVTNGQELPPSCVITMNTQIGRNFITVDMSDPGILL